MAEKENNKITTPESVLKTKTSESTIERNIYKLKEDNKLKRIGSEQSGVWKVKV